MKISMAAGEGIPINHRKEAGGQICPMFSSGSNAYIRSTLLVVTAAHLTAETDPLDADVSYVGCYRIRCFLILWQQMK